MPKVTVNIIGRDQALTLAQAIRSAAPFPVIYFDAGSEDDSRQLAHSLGALVLTHDAIRTASEMRNYAAACAETEYCLCLSSDDVLEPVSIGPIIAALDSQPATCVIEVREAKSPGVSHRGQRVWRRGIKWKGRAHEYLDANEIIDIQGAVITHHRGPWHDKPTDADGVVKCLQADIAENPNEPRWWFYLAREYYHAGHWIAAVALLKKRIAMKGFAPEVADARLMLSRCFHALDQRDEARSEAVKALLINPQFAEAARWMARIGQPEDAEHWTAMAAAATNDGVLFIRDT